MLATIPVSYTHLYPNLSLFVTPEVGVSDLWQFNVPVKLLMSQAIDGGFIPWWTSAIGTGFPILAESQMGFFNGFSLLLYSLFPHLVAFNSVSYTHLISLDLRLPR